MCNLKKVLALVLVVAMIASFSISASAAFTDQDDVSYTTAVEVLTGLGVINGYADGSFRPDGNVTRGAFTKMVAYVMNGGTNAATSYGTAAASSFSDVKSTDTFANSIGYCVSKGIISGYTNGTFRAGNNVTGVQGAKMLLGALGYSSEYEGYTGAAWATNVLGDAEDAGLFVGLNTVDMTQPLSREQAAQMIWNAMQATMVKYSTGGVSITTPDGTQVSTGASAAEPVSWVQQYTGDTEFGTANQRMEMVERYFPGLATGVGGNGDFMRPVTNYVLTTGNTQKTIASVATTPTLTYTTAVTGTKIYSDLGLTANPASVIAYVNGTQGAAVGDAGANVAAGNTGKIGGNGVLTEVYYDVMNPTTVTIVQVQYKLAYVSNVVSYAATAAKGGYTRYTVNDLKYENNVYVSDTTSKAYDVYASVVNQATDKDSIVIDGSVAKDQYVLIVTDAAKNMTYMTPATTITGALSGGTATTYTIGGSAYNISALPVVGSTKATFSTALFSATQATNFALDQYGNVLAPIATTVVPTYVYVAAAEDAYALSGTTLVKSISAYVVDTQGTLSTMNVSNVGGTTVDTTNGASMLTPGLYTYRQLPNGTYQFDAATPANTLSGANFNYATSPVISGSVMGNANTVFYTVNMANGKPASVTTTTGMANMGNVTGANGAYLANNNIASYVFLNSASTGTAAQLVYFLGSFNYGTDGSILYDVIAGGEKTTVKGTTGFTTPGLYNIDGSNEANAVTASGYSNGAATYVAADTMYTLTNNGGLLYVTSTVISTGVPTTSYVAPVANNVPVYVISASAGTCTTGTSADLSAVANASVVVLTPNSSNGIGAIYAVVA